MTISVFIADDHAIVREGLAALLEAQSDIHVVGVAVDGRTAVSEITNLAPDIVIMDITMPQLNGIEAAREIHARMPQTRIVILSMHSGAEHVFHALMAGATGYLLKESVGQEIVDAVRAVHAGRRYFSTKVAEVMAELVGQGSAVSPIESLSARERQVLQLVADGLSSTQIAAALNLSPKSVDTYRSRLMQKLQVDDVVGLVKFAVRHGLTSPD